MNFVTKQWSTVADLPQPVACAPAAVCGDHVYILGRSNMYTCSIITLIQSRKSFQGSSWKRGVGTWKEVAGVSFTGPACVSIHGRLLVIGGMDSARQPTTAIHVYNPTTDSWEVISHMATPRCACIAGILPNNQLMVVGGRTGTGFESETDSVEFATIE